MIKKAWSNKRWVAAYLMMAAFMATIAMAANAQTIDQVVVDAQSGVPTAETESDLQAIVEEVPETLGNEGEDYVPPCPTIDPGDVVNTASTCGIVDVGDVVRALRMAVGMNDWSEGEYRAADLAPAMRRNYDGIQYAVAVGDGQVNIADVVLLLRAAVGIEKPIWAERKVLFDYVGSEIIAGFVGTVYVDRRAAPDAYWQSAVDHGFMYQIQEDWYTAHGMVSTPGFPGPVRLAEVRWKGPWNFPWVDVELANIDGGAIAPTYCGSEELDIQDTVVQVIWSVRGDGMNPDVEGGYLFCPGGRG